MNSVSTPLFIRFQLPRFSGKNEPPITSQSLEENGIAPDLSISESLSEQGGSRIDSPAPIEHPPVTSLSLEETGIQDPNLIISESLSEQGGRRPDQPISQSIDETGLPFPGVVSACLEEQGRTLRPTVPPFKSTVTADDLGQITDRLKKPNTESGGDTEPTV